MTDWKNLSFATPRKRGQSQKKPVTNEDDGTRAGYLVEHWDDHVDAVAQPKPIRVKAKAQLEDG